MKLLRDIPNVDKALWLFRAELDWSYERMARYFTRRGFRCNDRTVARVCKRLGVIADIHKKGSFYNRKHKEETKLKISSVRKERGISKGKSNFFYGKCGEQAPNWKGGKSKQKALFYAGSAWANKRFFIMKRDNFVCRQCGFNPGNLRNTLNVHHIIPLSVDWDLRLEDTNLVTLCEKCHIDTFGRELDLVSSFQDIVRSL